MHILPLALAFFALVPVMALPQPSNHQGPWDNYAEHQLTRVTPEFLEQFGDQVGLPELDDDFWIKYSQEVNKSTPQAGSIPPYNPQNQAPDVPPFPFAPNPHAHPAPRTVRRSERISHGGQVASSSKTGKDTPRGEQSDSGGSTKEERRRKTGNAKIDPRTPQQAILDARYHIRGGQVASSSQAGRDTPQGEQLDSGGSTREQRRREARNAKLDPRTPQQAILDARYHRFFAKYNWRCKTHGLELYIVMQIVTGERCAKDLRLRWMAWEHTGKNSCHGRTDKHGNPNGIWVTTGNVRCYAWILEREMTKKEEEELEAILERQLLERQGRAVGSATRFIAPAPL